MLRALAGVSGAVRVDRIGLATAVNMSKGSKLS